QFRGGAGLSIMVTPHDVERIPDLALHSHGLEVPTAFGLYGGYPGSANQSVIKRDTKIEELFKAGAIPQELNQLEGKIEITPGVISSYLNRGDIYYCLSCGGGGYGDPLERDPELVLKDIQNGTVSGEWARRTYGVVVIEQNVAVNINATGVRRRAIFRERQKSATLPIPFHQPVAARPAGKRINAWLLIVHSQKNDFIQCRCGHILRRISEDYRDHTAVAKRPWHKTSPYIIKPGRHSSFQMREFYCPGCYTLLDVDVIPL
ncbi:MAG: acetone carboxylase subunit gamma, partial [Dehalococcoidia bacterium]|nr:acetone carboxylase subunit gamma [Dehalococcoidia bacterium]